MRPRTKLWRCYIALWGLVTILTGCFAAHGPVHSPELFERKIAEAIPKEDGAVQISGPGAWLPNERGFIQYRNWLPQTPFAGVTVVTSRSILFQQWDGATERFDTVKRLPFSEVAEVRVDSWGLSRILVIRKKDLSFDSFQFSQINGISSDAAKIEAAYNFIRQQIDAGVE